MPVLSKEIQIQMPFSNRQVEASRTSIVTRRDQVKEVGRITPHAKMLPVVESGCHFVVYSAKEIVRNNERLITSGQEILIDPGLGWGESFSYTVPFGIQMEKSGSFLWPIKHPTDLISVRIERTNGFWPENWQASLGGVIIPTTYDEGIEVSVSSEQYDLVGNNLQIAWQGI